MVSQSTEMKTIIVEIYKVVQVTKVLLGSTYKVKLKYTQKNPIDWLEQCEEVEEN